MYNLEEVVTMLKKTFNNLAQKVVTTQGNHKKNKETISSLNKERLERIRSSRLQNKQR